MTSLNYNHIHSVYCSLTNREMPCSINMHFAWEKWHLCGWCEEDLKLTVKYIKELIKKERRRPESFRFNNLIMDTDRFAEDLGEARAHFRGTRVDPKKAEVLRATGRSEIPEKPVRSAADVLAGNEAFKQFLNLKEAL